MIVVDDAVLDTANGRATVVWLRREIERRGLRGKILLVYVPTDTHVEHETRLARLEEELAQDPRALFDVILQGPVDADPALRQVERDTARHELRETIAERFGALLSPTPKTVATLTVGSGESLQELFEWHEATQLHVESAEDSSGAISDVVTAVSAWLIAAGGAQTPVAAAPAGPGAVPEGLSHTAVAEVVSDIQRARSGGPPRVSVPTRHDVPHLAAFEARLRTALVIAHQA